MSTVSGQHTFHFKNLRESMDKNLDPRNAKDNNSMKINGRICLESYKSKNGQVCSQTQILSSYSRTDCLKNGLCALTIGSDYHQVILNGEDIMSKKVIPFSDRFTEVMKSGNYCLPTGQKTCVIFSPTR